MNVENDHNAGLFVPEGLDTFIPSAGEWLRIDFKHIALIMKNKYRTIRHKIPWIIYDKYTMWYIYFTSRVLV